MDESIMAELLKISVENSKNLAALNEKVHNISENVEKNSEKSDENFKELSNKLDDIVKKHEQNVEKIEKLERILDNKSEKYKMISKMFSGILSNWKPIVVATIIALALFGFKVDPAIINTVIPGISRIVDSTEN